MSADEWAAIAFMAYFALAVFFEWLGETKLKPPAPMLGLLWPFIVPLSIATLPIWLLLDAIRARGEEHGDD